MKNYKEYNKTWIGESDVAALILVGCGEDGMLQSTVLKFGGDDAYLAYVVDEEASIGSHYKKVAEFWSWMSIYDDSERTARFKAQKICVYRAGEYGCIIQLCN